MWIAGRVRHTHSKLGERERAGLVRLCALTLAVQYTMFFHPAYVDPAVLRVVDRVVQRVIVRGNLTRLREYLIGRALDFAFWPGGDDTQEMALHRHEDFMAFMRHVWAQLGMPLPAVLPEAPEDTWDGFPDQALVYAAVERLGRGDETETDVEVWPCGV